ncbi:MULTISPECIES: PaaI family thioesterase [unclassified Variovorax]|uniref:PaaI family thioesterase n=1 Tax=unclassified Variovorax TaxID=663243 RepID=UPI003F46FB2B
MEIPVDPFEKLAATGWRRVRTAGAFMSGVGPLWALRENESWVYGVWAGDAHLNPAGVVHGGLLATLADHAISTVAWEAAGRTPCVTVQLDTQFLAPVAPGVLIEARAQVVRRTASLLFMRGLLQVAGLEVLIAQALMKVQAPLPSTLEVFASQHI